MNAIDSAAYDYGRFEERDRIEIKKLAKTPAAEKRVGILKAACWLLCAVVLLSALIYARVEQNVLNSEYEKTLATTNSIKGQNAQMQVQLEQMLSLDNIAEIAKEEIGLNEIRSQQIEYVEFDTEVKTEVVEQGSFWAKTWNDIVGWFRNVLL